MPEASSQVSGWRKAPDQLAALFDKALPDDPRVERRKMFGYPAAFVGGRMFAGLYQESLVLKLPEPDRTRLLAERAATPFEPRPGQRMGEFVVLSAAALADASALRDCLLRSLDYVAALPEKPTNSRRRSQK